MKKLNYNFLISPWAILIGMTAGIIIGLYFKSAIPILKPIGDIYISVLQMCVIPIMASAIVISIGKLMKSEKASKYMTKIVTIFIMFLLAVSILTLTLSALCRPFTEPDSSTKKAIGKIMLDSEAANGNLQPTSVINEIDSRFYIHVESNQRGIIDFIINIIPKNIFSALNNGENLKIIFFFIILGIMMKFISHTAYVGIATLCEGVYEAFQKIIRISMIFLPFGLCALMATQFSTIGFSIIASLVKLIIFIYLIALVIAFLSSLIIWKYSGYPYSRQFKVLRNVIIICLGTRNSFAAIPSAISGLHRGLDIDLDKVNLTIPLGITLCRYGTLMTFSIAAIFAMQLYGHTLKFDSFIIIIITSILTAMAASGAPGIVSKTMVGLILTPLGIPAGAIIVILIALDPIIDPVITLLNVYPNCAAATMIAAGQDKDEVLIESKVLQGV